MAIVAPLIGAAIGYGIGGAIPAIGSTLGANLGWMVGSLFMRTKSKPIIIDPGAQQWVPTNTSVRGASIPILFGTNRVNSQIVYQANLSTTKTWSVQKTGSKKNKQKTFTANYTYALDQVYHFGMPLNPVKIIRAWVDDTLCSQHTVDALNSTGGLTGSLSSIAAQLGTQNGAVLSYSDAHFASGDYPQAQWPFLTSAVGGVVTWPKTSWVGFRQLQVGDSPRIPAFGVEIGPAQSSFSANPNFEIHTDFDYTHRILIGITDYGDAVHIYRQDNGTEHCITMLRKKTGEFVTHSTPEIVAMFPWGVNGTPNAIVGGLVVGNSLVLLLFNGLTQFRYCTVHIAANGSLSAGGYCGFFGGPFAGPTPIYQGNGSCNVLHIGGLKTLDDPIYIMDCNSTSLTFIKLPSYNTVNSLSDQTASCPITEYNPGYVSFANFFNWGVQIGYFGTQSPSSDVGCIIPQITYDKNGNPIITDYLVIYAPKALMQAGGGNCPAIAAWAAARPNGAMLALKVNGGTAFEDWTDRFTDLGGAPVVPFSDAGKLHDGTPDSHVDYSPIGWRIVPINGNFALILIKDDNTLAVDATTLDYVVTRIFLFTPGTNTFVQYVTGQVSPFRVSDFGYGTSGGRISLQYTGWLDPTTLQLWMLGQTQNNASIGAGSLGGVVKGDPYWAQLADVSASATDLTPPEIIREILANPFFGLGFDYTDIDTGSYTLAVAFCTNHNFLVSTQYRTSNGALGVIEQLLYIYGGYLTVDAGTRLIKFGVRQWTSIPVRTLDNNHFVIDQSGQAPVQVTKMALQDTVNKVLVSYQDRSIDYKQNQVEEADEVDQDLHGVRLKEFPAQFVMSQNTARSMALRALINNMYVRDQYDLKLGWKDADLEPGDVVTLVDSFANLNTTARILKWIEKKRGVFQVTLQQELQFASDAYANSAYNTATSGYVADTNLQTVYPPEYFQMYEVPYAISGTTNGDLYVGWAGPGNPRGATLYTSPDNITFGAVTQGEPYDTYGIFTAPLANNPSVVLNAEVILQPRSLNANSGDTVWHYEFLQDVSAAARGLGASLIWIGSEMVAYEGVTLVSTNHYRFDKLYRGWGGTKVSDHSSGQIWTMHLGAIQTTYEASDIGKTFWYKVVPYNFLGIAVDISSVVAKKYTIVGLAQMPMAPSGMSVVWSGDDYRGNTQFKVNTTGDITVAWKDTLRGSGYGYVGYGLGATGYGESLFDAISKSYLVNVYGSGSVLVHSELTTNSWFTYSSANNIAENGAWRGNVAFVLKARGSYGDNPNTTVLSLNLFT